MWVLSVSLQVTGITVIDGDNNESRVYISSCRFDNNDEICGIHWWTPLNFVTLSVSININWFAGKVDTCYMCYLPGDCFRLTEFVTVIIYLTHCCPEVVLCILPYIFILMNQVRSTFKCIIRFEPTERLMKV